MVIISLFILWLLKILGLLDACTLHITKEIHLRIGSDMILTLGFRKELLIWHFKLEAELKRKLIVHIIIHVCCDVQFNF